MCRILIAYLCILSGLKAESYFNPFFSLKASVEVHSTEPLINAIKRALLDIKKNQPLEYEQFFSNVKFDVAEILSIKTPDFKVNNEPIGKSLSKLCWAADAGYIVDESTNTVRVFKLSDRDEFYYLNDAAVKVLNKQKCVHGFFEKHGIVNIVSIDASPSLRLLKVRGSEKCHSDLSALLKKISASPK